MTDPVAQHYSHGNLLGSIRSGINALGRTEADVTVDDLAPADEFHIGGRQASEDFLGQLGLDAAQQVLDVGCGIGGTSRFAASRFGCRVCGIDLTPEFVETGRTLCDWVGLGERITLHVGDATDLPFDNGAFDAAFMLHVGMNIPDKGAVFAEVFRTLRPGSIFGVYDVMRQSDEPLTYPVPWASVPATSALATPGEYVALLESAGFAVEAQRDRREFAAEFFAETRRKMAAAGASPPPLGVHIAMGESAPAKITNMVDNIAAGRCAPVEIIARRA